MCECSTVYRTFSMVSSPYRIWLSYKKGWPHWFLHEYFMNEDFNIYKETMTQETPSKIFAPKRSHSTYPICAKKIGIAKYTKTICIQLNWFTYDVSVATKFVWILNIIQTCDIVSTRNASDLKQTKMKSFSFEFVTNIDSAGYSLKTDEQT